MPIQTEKIALAPKSSGLVMLLNTTKFPVEQICKC